jgi:hypothetical protein
MQILGNGGETVAVSRHQHEMRVLRREPPHRRDGDAGGRS